MSPMNPMRMLNPAMVPMMPNVPVSPSIPARPSEITPVASVALGYCSVTVESRLARMRLMTAAKMTLSPRIITTFLACPISMCDFHLRMCFYAGALVVFSC